MMNEALRILFLSLITTFPVICILLIKNSFFKYFTWAGFLTQYKSIIAILSLFLPSILIFGSVIGVNINIAGLTELTTYFITPPALYFSGPALAIMLVFFGVISLAFGPKDHSNKLILYVENHNWLEAKIALSGLEKKPIHPEVLRIFQVFTESAETAARHNFPSVNELRQQRHTILTLLDSTRFFRELVVRSYADNAKSIYFQERDEDIIDSAIELIQREISKSKQILRTIFTMKIGELYLAARKYDDAKEAFNSSIPNLANGTIRSKSLTNLGNIFATEGNFTTALSLYEQAEDNYPEGYRHIFYSNLAYIQLLAGDVENAIKSAQRALIIDKDDWYSYLNLGLAYDEIGKHIDAQHNYRKVIKNEKSNPDAIIESMILLGRSLEISGAPPEEYIKVYLDALDRDSTGNSISEIILNHDEYKKIYESVSDALKQVNTHGIERYNEWFVGRVKEIDSDVS